MERQDQARPPPPAPDPLYPRESRRGFLLFLGYVSEGPSSGSLPWALSEEIGWRECFGIELWPRERELLAADRTRDPWRPPVEVG